MSTDLALFIFCPLFLGLGMMMGYLLFRAFRREEFSSRTRRSLDYTRRLLDNYHAAHQSSPLTDLEIREVLTLCKAEIDRVLAD